MSTWAFVYPGQGAQEIGMGREMAETCSAAMDVWEEALDVLGTDLRDVAWNGSAEQLARTDVTQPALLTAEIACFRAVQSAGCEAIAAAGHSLGEYSALVTADAMDFADALRVVQVRGNAMQAAAETSGGGMAAVIGADLEALEAVCKEIGGVAPANLNAPGQVVVSGTDEGLKTLGQRAAEVKARRFVRLNVAGPFHSPAMVPAAQAVAAILENVNIRVPRIPVYSNVTAAPQDTPDAIRANLYAQVTGRVRWTEIVNHIAAVPGRRFLEIGPGQVLSGLMRRISPESIVQSVGNPASLNAFLEVAE